MQLGFIGLGRMGSRMAGRLLGAGHDLVVHDVEIDAVGSLVVDRGATAASSAREVADLAETVLTSLPTPASVLDVLLAPDGVAQGTAVRRVVDLSTTGTRTARRLAEELGLRGVASIDAPVSGGTSGAEKGTLAVMAAASAVEFDAVSPVLATLGRVFHVGTEPGLGQAMKLVNNYLSAAALATTSEAMVVGVRAGLDPRTMLDVLNAGSGRNSATQDKFPRSVLPGTFDFGFATALMEKDLGLFADEAAALAVPTWVGAVVHQMWRQTRDRLGPDSDFTSIVRLVEGWAGIEVRADVQGGPS
ncbi:NAD(P)-dependent oxidoreductase [Pseudonocardia sp. EV170527-09]|uniref:NAD(P)-dependent oxidoreductase n=1 Tax=Pseudonocardia sp. EV170527-09 TaxID=2603411 RepID=UPI0011F13DDF|nr:NAD(P)-dependent oxidoreductase [Pseudonocardia sp. EV170527-09]KAA1033894.1 NAD(P)-dependent oxidoreductase [Pseudonocardia sp. EV170527-09]